MIEDRVKYRPGDGAAGIVPITNSPRFTSTHITRRNLSFSPNNINSSPNAAMWMFTAQQVSFEKCTNFICLTIAELTDDDILTNTYEVQSVE